MGPPKSKSASGLGRTLINDRQKAIKQARADAVSGKIPRHTTETHDEPNWVKLRSITQEKPLEEFLSTAELAGTEFTAERKSIKIITTDSTTNPYLLTPAQESQLLKKQSQKKSALTVPRRPAWSTNTTPTALDLAERESFLEWRRGLAQLQESDDLLLTPFERNIEVWRQLWRVIERSDLVVQIVDARNPLLFRTEDLEKYVSEVDPEKRNLLLVNKADLMTLEQRRGWADWFESQGIRFAFYSARLAKEAQEKDAEMEEDEEEEEEEDEEDDEKETGDADEEAQDEKEDDDLAEEVDDLSIDSELSDDDINEESHPHLVQPTSTPSYTIPPQTEEDTDPRTQILTVHELQSLFLRESPPPKGHDPAHPQKIIVGLVGYPNVGKSSTINSLLGEKRVSVSSTPGKTKHFQTIHLSPPDTDTPGVILCDCPGLVFPNFASTKAELVCNGVLPIDQLREWTGPGELIARRIPKEVLEQVYSFKVYTKADTEEGAGQGVTGEELLISFALARGFTKAGPVGNPDDARAARILLKDFVNGKILYCHPPPGIFGEDFNRGHYTPSPVAFKPLNPNAPVIPDHRAEVDDGFFKEGGVRARTKGGVYGGRNMQYGHQKAVGDDGKMLSRKERKLREEASGDTRGKKHFKGRGKK